MQVFLPYPDFVRSVGCLDKTRLGNQVYREALTLLRGGWPNHPAAKMWQNYKSALAMYALAGLDELKRRGRDYPHHRATFLRYLNDGPAIPPMPHWLGNDAFHASHRAALLYKDFAWYSQFGWSESPAVPDAKGRLPYVWLA